MVSRILLAVLIAAPAFAQNKPTQIGSGQTLQLSAPAVTWSVNPAIGTVSDSGLYQAPATNAVQQIVVVTASAAGQTIFSQSVTLLPDVIPVTLPIEVGGVDGSIVSVPFIIPSTANLAGPFTIALRFHNLKYETEASLRVNNGAWVPLNTSTLSLQGLATAYGGIGGGFSTFRVTMALPGAIAPGLNSVSFRFNGTDGFTSEFRVLEFNISAAGTPILPASTFIQDDPAKWTPLLPGVGDIAAGKALFQTQQLYASHMASLIKARCSDCHAQDGRDLKYFNYDNKSIVDRAVFHGLTVQQGNQIASYIRSLSTPSPGRPWNPPYQPGPGLDSQPVETWSAGSGIDAVADSDVATFNVLMPGGSAANWVPTGYVNARELPIALQLPDWNSWLPQVHPIDAWGTAFTSSTLYTNYQTIRGLLRFQDPVAYVKAKTPMQFWVQRDMEFVAGKIKPATDPAWSDPNYVSEVYSTRLWEMVKWWEMNQEFGLEGMSKSIFGPQAAARSWFTNVPFMTSPNMLHIPTTAFGPHIRHTYFSYIWYQLQLILNDGNGTFGGTVPIDFAYVYSYPPALATNSPVSPSPSHMPLTLMWLLKGLQASNFGAGPEKGSSGWQYWASDPTNLLLWPNNQVLWTDFVAQRQAILTSYISVWVPKLTSFTAALMIAGKWVDPSVPPDPTNPNGPFVGNRLAWIIPQLTYYGVPRQWGEKLAAWGKTIWPTYDWTGALNKTCTEAAGHVTCK